jgi:hypothetical protein
MHFLPNPLTTLVWETEERLVESEEEKNAAGRLVQSCQTAGSTVRNRQQPTNQTFQIVIFAPRWGNARLFCLFGWMANKKKVRNLDARAHHAHHRRNRATMKMKT